MSDFFKQAVDDYQKLSNTEYLRNVTTPFVPEALDDSRMIQQLSVAVARIMENGSASSGLSNAELIEEEDLFVAALGELNIFF